jgi:hypothetical protein
MTGEGVTEALWSPCEMRVLRECQRRPEDQDLRRPGSVDVPNRLRILRIEHSSAADHVEHGREARRSTHPAPCRV